MKKFVLQDSRRTNFLLQASWLDQPTFNQAVNGNVPTRYQGLDEQAVSRIFSLIRIPLSILIPHPVTVPPPLDQDRQSVDSDRALDQDLQ